MRSAAFPEKELRLLPGVKVRFEVDMANHCTFRTGGKARALAVVETEQGLRRLLALCRRTETSWRLLGRGSNILVRDEGFAGVLIRLGGEFAEIEFLKGDRVRAGAAVFLSSLVNGCCQRGLSGLEFLAGIPGSVGGALYMNAGAFGREIAPLIETVALIDEQGEQNLIAGSGLTPGYRRLGIPLAGKSVITGAVFALARRDRQQIRSRMEECLARRRAGQPRGAASAGSFFRNPPGEYAGRLIEAAGLKGLRVGGAMVSPVHANFIVNTGSATATDILELMRLIQEKVLAETSIFLEPEVHIF